MDDVPDDLQPNYTNNALVDEAIARCDLKNYEQFEDQSDKIVEMLSPGQRIKWTKCVKTTLVRTGTVIYDNKSSVLVQFDTLSSPSWVSKRDLTKL